MNQLGHNERSYRLDLLAADARRGLENVEKGEEFTIGGWLAYGHALNEGRALFPSDEQFGRWIAEFGLCQLGTHDVNRHDRAAAMWAAANADQFEEARLRGNPRTIRGIHAKWKEIEAERDAVRRAEEQQAGQEAELLARTVADETAPITDEAEGTAKLGAQHAAMAHAEAPAQAVLIDEANASDPEAEARKSLAVLTRLGLEDEVLGLRATLVEERVRRKQAEAERDEWKAKFQHATSESDLGRSLGLALRQRDTAKGRLGEELAKNARLGRQIKRLEAERAELQRSLEMQEIPLG